MPLPSTAPVRRHYTAKDRGPLCAAGCGTHIVRQLAEAGITEHPSCERRQIVGATR